MCFSDTHGKIDYIPEDQIYPCDVLIFAGDFSNFGNPEEVHNFVNWIDKHGARDNIVISGNSELPFETKKLDQFKDVFMKYNSNREIKIEDVKGIVLNDKKIRYLEHEGCVIDGIKIFGSPYSPAFMNLAFNTTPEEAKEIWKTVPNDVDVLVTHSPPKDILDKTNSGFHAGCPELRKAIERVKPALCIFGHIHEANGMQRIDGTLYCNVALAGEDSLNKPMYIDIIKNI